MTYNKSRKNAASALIIVVILTSLLAIIGVMFIMVARVDKMATSAISENKELNFAVEAVAASVSKELVLDVPRTDSNGLKLSEYYDYPGEEDKWLASIEPYFYSDNGTPADTNDDIYKWRQISDVTGYIKSRVQSGAWLPVAWHDVPVKPTGLAATKYVPEYPALYIDASGEFLDENGNPATQGVSADADGDGIADSKWIELDGITSNKGKPIYAAIRIVDNGGMLNVNTAYKFNPNETDANLIDGSSQLQINLAALARGSDTIDGLAGARNPLGRPLLDYLDGLIWRIEDPCSDYLPFDISDELELRNRFFLTSLAKTRLEAAWDSTIGNDGFKRIPYDSDMAGWFAKFDPNSNELDRRHYLAIYNIDRIIKPDCNKMTNVNTADVNALYNSIRKGLVDTNYPDVNGAAAQIAVNLLDFRDNDSNVTVYTNPDDGKTYYGFECPCIYISELVHRFEKAPPPPGGPMGAPPIYYQAYAIELYKPYSTDSDPCNWRLVIGPAPGGPMGAPPAGTPYYITQWSGNRQFYVMRNDPCEILTSIDPNNAVIENSTFILERGSSVVLQRCIDEANGIWLPVDSQTVPNELIPANPAEGTNTCQRDINLHKCIRGLWSGVSTGSTLGSTNGYNDNLHPEIIQAHPENKPFTNVGEIGMLFRKSAYSQGPNPIGPSDTEATARFNLADPCYQNLFQYLTVFDPSKDGINNDGDRMADGSEIIDEDDPNLTPEWKIPGRINISTAPWYVLAQLPWVSDEIAQAIVAYRDAQQISGGPDYTGRSERGFANIGQLNNVNDGPDDYKMRFYATDGNDLAGFPDLTTLPTGGDEAPDDFEERDVIFARISNLVTVRSDVFTAYILVRIGADGPQKRVMAILDRSNVYSPTDKVRVIAIHPVPDPR